MNDFMPRILSALVNTTAKNISMGIQMPGMTGSGV
jgi:hypothetical protein